MANGWTDERRKRQSILIHTWKPFNKSTGPRTPEGKYRSSLNALKHGVRGKFIRDITALLKQYVDTNIRCVTDARASEPLS